MSRGQINHPNTKSLKLSKLNFAIPLMACAGLGAIGVFAINQDIDETASASNSTTLSSTVSYDDEYITISNSTAVSLGSADVTAADAYVFASDNVTVSTNVATGYDLYISSGNKENSALTTPEYYTEIAATSGTGGDYGTPAVLDANSYGYAVPSGLATNSGFDASYSSPSSSSKFAGVPAGTSDRIHSTTGPNEDGDTTDVHYGAYLTNYLAEGTYTGEIVYSAVVTPTRGTVPMEVSPASGVEGTELTIVSGPTNISTSHELATSEVEVYFKQSGATKDTCKVTKVDPSEGHLITTCIVPKLDDGKYDLILNVPRYGFTDIVSSGYTAVMTMQSPKAANACAGLQETTSPSNTHTYELIDSRNSEKYFIRKFTLNNTPYCMMVENLYLTSYTTLEPSTSNVSTSYTLPSNGGSFHPNDSTYAEMSNGVRHRYVPDGNMDGSYYNWCAATAGTGGCYKTNKAAGVYDICPKYWRLPTSTEQGYIDSRIDYTTGINTFFTDITGNAASPLYTGLYYGSSLNSLNSNVSWWSSTQASANTAFSLNANNETLSTSNSANKYYGYSIRCLIQAAE